MSRLYLGIDIGSLTVKGVLMDPVKGVIGHALLPTGHNSLESAKGVIAETLSVAGIKEGDVKIIATGYGRHFIPFAQEAVTEITCHGRGALYFFPQARTVIDIGGQDSKVIHVDPVTKRVLNFKMNDKCAAGTGRFLEVMAERLRLTLEEFISQAIKTKEALKISSVCTVFAETEVVSLVAQNKPLEMIARGLHLSVVERLYPMLRDVGLRKDVIMTGGGALNTALVTLLEEKTGEKLHVPRDPQFTGALGAALLGMEKDGAV